ncbi:hypothetical protein CCS79_13530 [Clostridium diolis]|uniref:hypothetical protein n=1 Tax=Clostridium diolis TaxID=223919 RepID=UPI000B3FBDC0|nr:hypothetical protein [Clostridium diolis]OVE67971.1 hypothetical protein CCS79_13530 [Clostridium diolis]
MDNEELYLLSSKRKREERLKAYKLAHEIVINLSKKNISYSTAKLALSTAIDEIGELKLIDIDS